MTITIGKMIADVLDPHQNHYTTELYYTEHPCGLITCMWNLSGQQVIGYDGDRKVYLLESQDETQ